MKRMPLAALLTCFACAAFAQAPADAPKPAATPDKKEEKKAVKKKLEKKPTKPAPPKSPPKPVKAVPGTEQKLGPGTYSTGPTTLRDKDGNIIPTSPDAYDVSSATKKK